MEREPHRINLLDGLRGVAALQVVLLHYATAFAPAIGLVALDRARQPFEAWFIKTPLFFLFDGFFAVCIFFLISGAVLTHSFARVPFAVEAHVVRRLIRLGLPTAASVAFGFAVLLLTPDIHLTAARLSGSTDWLGSLSPPMSLQSAAAQILFSGLVTGYEEVSLFPDFFHRYGPLVPLAHSFNPPLWTLHIELYGSLEVLALVAVRAAFGKRPHAIACCLTLILVGVEPLSLFVLGHVMAQLPTSQRWRRMTKSWIVAGIAAALIGLGVASSAHAFDNQVDNFFHFLDALRVNHVDGFHCYGVIGAVLLYCGLMASPALWGLFENRPMRWLGRVSFSLYLTHFPVLLSVASAAYVLAQGTEIPGIIASLVGLAVGAGVAAAFERWVDRPSVILSRWVGAALTAAPAAAADSPAE